MDGPYLQSIVVSPACSSSSHKHGFHLALTFDGGFIRPNLLPPFFVAPVCSTFVAVVVVVLLVFGPVRPGVFRWRDCVPDGSGVTAAAFVVLGCLVTSSWLWFVGMVFGGCGYVDRWVGTIVCVLLRFELDF